MIRRIVKIDDLVNDWDDIQMYQWSNVFEEWEREREREHNLHSMPQQALEQKIKYPGYFMVGYSHPFRIQISFHIILNFFSSSKKW